MLLRYCSNCGTPNSVDPARLDKRTFCLACGEVLQLIPPTAPSIPSATEVLPVHVVQPPLPPPIPAPHVTLPLSSITTVPAPVVVSPSPAPVVAEVVQRTSRWEYPPGAPVTPAATTAQKPFAPADTAEVVSATVTAPVATTPAEALAAPKPRRRRFPRLHGSTGFLTSMVVHTIAILVLSLLIVRPEIVTPVMAFVSSRPAHHAEEELLVEEFQAIEVEAEVDTIAQISEEETLDSSAQVNLAEALSETTGDNESSAGEFTLPEGLMARVPGSGGGVLGAAASSASFAKRLRRENAKSGDVQISLLWNNYNDIDLHVRCPSGELISFDHRKSRCRGELDVDMNAEGRVSDEPVENIFWPAGKAPFGEYYVVVNHYRNHGDDDPTQFEVEVKVDGRVRKMTGELRYGDPPQIVDRFTRTKGGTPDDDFYVE